MELVTVRRCYNNNTPSWEEAFYNFNNSICKNELVKIRDGFFVSHNAQRINCVQDVLNDLECKYGVLTITLNFARYYT